ncbi:AAA domain-containing protein [Paracoccus litorisediminis]|uniref:AAA domain-containing protein n=1 Tax=Paracoccus litorisediminis TaxID=2006130 RepID=UPI0037326700
MTDINHDILGDIDAEILVEQARQDAILNFWGRVEMFDINQLDRQKDSRDSQGKFRIRRHEISRGGALPWIPGARNHIPDNDDHMWFHLVYGGTARRSDMVRRITGLLCPESEVSREEMEDFGGDTWSFAMMLTSEGRPFRESFTIANYAMATHLAARGADLDTLKVVIEGAVQRFQDANPDSGLSIHPEAALAGGVDGVDGDSDDPDDGDRNEVGSSGWTIGEHVMDWERLGTYLKLRDGILGNMAELGSRDMTVISIRMDRPKPDFRGKIGRQRIPEWSVLNSFYLEGIQRVIANSKSVAGTALESYIAKPVSEAERVDLIADPVAMAKAASPSRMPLGRWPSNPAHALMFGQQAAVGEIVGALSESSGVVAVNGPPGSGKTTTLREIIAHVVVSRAAEIAKLDHPHKIFKRHGIESGEDEIMVLQPAIADGMGIVVASANNAAVDNISREIPLETTIDRESFPTASYLPSLGRAISDRRTLYQIRKGLKLELEGRPAWGLLGAAFGRKSNVSNFFAKIMAGRPGEHDAVKVHGLSDELYQRGMEMRHTKRGWHEIRADFLAQLGKITSTRTRLSESEAEIFSPRDTAAEMAALDEQRKKLEDRLERPNPGDTALHRKMIEERLGAIRDKISQLAWADIGDPAPGPQDPVTAPDGDFMARDHEARQRTSLWSNPSYDAARSRLFTLGLELIEASLVENRNSIMSNMRLMRDMMDGDGERKFSREGARALWDSAFLITPVISTTLASLSRNFANTGPGHIGWMLIDEAGQAAPQIVTEALWRARRGVIIGDPRQIEPVVTTPTRLVEAFRQKYGVDIGYSPSRSSAQAVADQVMAKGSLIQVGDEQPVWTGMPLRAHRRCVEPMFSIANSIAYGGQMVQVTPECRLEGHALGASSWLDLSGPRRAEGRVIHDEIELLRSCIDVLADDWPEKDGAPSDIFIITPFRDVAQAINRAIWSMESPGRIEAGTIHTFQGKEADVVFLVLGSAPGDVGKGSRDWAGSTPNMLNVALTRARSRVHVIGSAEDWGGVRNFDVLHQSMEDLGRLLRIEDISAKGLRAALRRCEPGLVLG